MTEHPEDLPPGDELIAAVKAAIADGQDPGAVLDQYAPAIDELADAAELADWLGYASRATIYQFRTRTNTDGSPQWPASDMPKGRSGLWRYRTIVLYRAALPGQGSAGRGPASRQTAQLVKTIRMSMTAEVPDSTDPAFVAVTLTTTVNEDEGLAAAWSEWMLGPLEVTEVDDASCGEERQPDSAARARRRELAGLLQLAAGQKSGLSWERLIRLAAQYGGRFDPRVTVAELAALRDVTVGELHD